MSLRHLSTLALLAAACSSCHSAKAPIVPTGYFPAKFALTDLSGDGTAIGYRSDSVKLSDYSGCYIAQVTVDPMAGDGADVDQADLAQLATQFGTDLAAAIGTKLPISQNPGPGILNASATILRAVPNKPLANLAPGSRILQRGYGYASVAVRIDSPDGSPVLGFADTRSTESLGGEKYSVWGSIDASFEAWSTEIAALLESR